MKKMDELKKIEIVNAEYDTACNDVKDGYNIIQQRLGLVVAAYSFVFSSYIGALSQWEAFRCNYGIENAISILFVVAFIPFLPASMITMIMKWKSIGNPSWAISILKQTSSEKKYKLARLDRLKETIQHNKKINLWLNKLILISLFFLFCSIVIIGIQVYLSINR